MFRKAVVAAAMLYFTASSNVLAIGLGDIEIHSTLNDPLSAVVELTSASKEELQELKVTIASRDSFDKLGISRPGILDDFRFNVEQLPGGKPVIRITTQQPVREPYLDFLIEATWSKGRLLRQYTLLVDPPVTMPAIPPAPRAPLVRQAPPPEAVQAPPLARIPTARPATVAPAPVIASGGADNYGPVKRSETLWDIAKRVRPGGDISIQQMMLALQRANPDAFVNNNINNMKAGVTLQIPQRDEILSLEQSAARREASRQYTEWQQGRGAERPTEQARAPEMAPKGQPASAPEPETETATEPKTEPAVESRLQLVAPEDETIKGAVAPGVPASGAAQAPDSQALLQQLSLATEEAEAGRAQSQELQSRVSKLEEQVTSMQRLIELKDEQLANLQNRLATQNQTPSANTAEETSSETQAPASDQMAASGDMLARTTPAANGRDDGKPKGIVDRLLDNPVLAGLGVLVAMILGGFLWASTRQRKTEDIFNDEPTLANQMSAVRNDEPSVRQRVAVSDDTLFSDFSADDMGPLQGDDASDPLTEADVFIAYGRVQQAEDVIKNALHGNPNRRDLKIKLLEIYHAAGNTAAFDAQAAVFRETVGESDPDWRRVAGMGYELSPANPLYQAAITLRAVQESDVEFGMDITGMEESPAAGNPAGNDIGLDYEGGVKGTGDYAENVDFNLDALDLNQEEGSLAEGLLDSSDEIGTKLDLARAYMDMGDPDGARGILKEVLEEGNDDQKVEAENLISRLA